MIIVIYFYKEDQRLVFLGIRIAYTRCEKDFFRSYAGEKFFFYIWLRLPLSFIHPCHFFATVSAQDLPFSPLSEQKKAHSGIDPRP